MTTQFILNKKYKANSLVEVIVVIAILSMTMISIVIVSTRSIRQVKKNELIDKSIALQLRSIEYAKTPNTLPVLDTMQNGDTKKFKIVISQNEGIEFVEATSGQDLTLDNCSASSEYFVDFENDDTLDTFCNQIVISAKDGASGLYYEIHSKIVYWVMDHFEESEMLGYRAKNWVTNPYYEARYGELQSGDVCGNCVLEGGEDCELDNICKIQSNLGYLYAFCSNCSYFDGFN